MGTNQFTQGSLLNSTTCPIDGIERITKEGLRLAAEPLKRVLKFAQLDFLALDVEGNVVGNDSVTVTSTFGWQPPAITSISPASAQPGDRITITGTEFHVGIRVLIDGQEAGGVEFDEASPQSLSAIVPWHRPGVFEVTVRNTDGRSAPPADFTILPPPPGGVGANWVRPPSMLCRDPWLTRIQFSSKR